MTTPIVRTTRPPGQDAGEDRLLGECHPTKSVRLTLRACAGKVVLWRHRSPGNSGPNSDPAAHITRVDGVVIIDWDDWHRKHRPVWMPSIEDWVRELLDAES